MNNVWYVCASGSRPKLKIICSRNLSRPLISTLEDDLPQDKIPGIGACISITLIPAIPIQIVVITTNALDEVRFTPEPLPAAACMQKLKSIIVCTSNEQGMRSIQGNVLTSEKAIFPPPDGAENIMDILDCDHSPTKCMIKSFIFFVSLKMLALWNPYLNSYLFLSFFVYFLF